MDHNMEIEMNVDGHEFCVSVVSYIVAEFGLNTVVQIWNSHSIPVKYLFDQEKNDGSLNGKRNLKIKS